jgi:hypothetical protein
MSFIFWTEIMKTDIFITYFFLIVAYELTNFIYNGKMTSFLERYSFRKRRAVMTSFKARELYYMGGV